MFRSVILSDLFKGKLYLHSMPGRHEVFAKAKDDIRKYRISKVVCLTPLEEIRKKSPEYFKAIQEKDILFDLVMFPISDYGIPDHPNRFLQLAKDIGSNLEAGENIPSPMISTDPPYYDMIPYAELSDFFYIWLRRLLSEIYPELFGTLMTPKSKELIADKNRAGGADEAKIFFEEGIFKAFSHFREITVYIS